MSSLGHVVAGELLARGHGSASFWAMSDDAEALRFNLRRGVRVVAHSSFELDGATIPETASPGMT